MTDPGNKWISHGMTLKGGPPDIFGRWRKWDTDEPEAAASSNQRTALSGR